MIFKEFENWIIQLGLINKSNFDDFLSFYRNYIYTKLNIGRTQYLENSMIRTFKYSNSKYNYIEHIKANEVEYIFNSHSWEQNRDIFVDSMETLDELKKLYEKFPKLKSFL